MKKLAFALLSVIMLLIALPQVGHADDALQLFLNGKRLQPEAPPRIVNDNTLVPVRLIVEELGAKVAWDGAARKVTLVKDDVNIQLFIDKKNVLVGGVTKTLEAAPFIDNGTTIVPLRFVAEHFGLKVNYDELTRSVSLYKQVTTVPGTSSPGSATPTPPASGSPTPSGAPSATPTPSPSVSPGSSAKPGATPTPSAPSEKVVQVQSIKTTTEQLIVQASGPLAPNFFYLTGPDRLVVDLPYAELGPALAAAKQGAEGTIASMHPDAAKIRYALNSTEPPTVRIVVDLNKKIDYNLVDTKIPGQLAIALKQARYKVVLDAGHGDQDSGAVSLHKKYEKDFTLAMVTKIAAILKQEPLIDLHLTRTDDTFVELDDRVKFANDLNASLFVSIHGNKYNPTIRGTETYYNRDASLPLANLLHQKIVAAAGFPDRNVRNADFRVIKYTTMPAVLCEIGYLSNAQDEAEMFKEDFQNRVAAAIAAGIKQYLKIQ